MIGRAATFLDCIVMGVMGGASVLIGLFVLLFWGTGECWTSGTLVAAGGALVWVAGAVFRGAHRRGAEDQG